MKHTNKLTRLLLVLLALVMMLSAFAACATENEEGVASTEEGGKNNQGNNGGVQVGGKWDGWALDENGYIMDTLPEDMSFGDEFLVLGDADQKSHFYVEEKDITGVDADGNPVKPAPVKEALYKRNATVEERLGITLQWKLESCGSSKYASFTEVCEADMSADHSIDAVIVYNLTPYYMANKGYLANLNDTTNINLEAPWWPQEYLSNVLYKDQIYALVDNASYGTLTNLSCIFFNNTLLNSKKIESPYDLVEKNEWTIPKLKELITNTYSDVDGDGAVDGESGGDIFGLCTSTAARLTCWYVGAGLRLSTINDNGELVLNTDVEEYTKKIGAITDMFSTKDSIVVPPSGTNQYIMFKEKRAYFYLCSVTLATSMNKDEIVIDYGVAPNPKLESTQPRYYTHVPNSHEAWCLLKGMKDEECSSAFIEAMASESYRQVNPVFFEDTLKVRYASDEKLAEMYDLIRESISFDFIYLYKFAFGSTNIDSEIRKCLQDPDKQWSGVWQGIEGDILEQYETILNIYEPKAQ